jgi:hypothetical protein
MLKQNLRDRGASESRTVVSHRVPLNPQALHPKAPRDFVRQKEVVKGKTADEERFARRTGP